MRLKRKIAKSKKVIDRAMRLFPQDKLAVAWTGGKDSTVLLHLVRQIGKGKVSLRVMFNDSRMEFDEVYELVDRLEKDWGLDLIRIAHPKDQLRRIGANKVRELKIEAIKKAVKGYDLEGLMVGIRWDEHKARAKEKYFSPRKDHMRVHPILHFTEKDIWKYIKRFKLPYVSLYDRGYRCYSSETKVLTKEGFKKFYELNEGDKVATLNRNKELQYRKTKRIFKYDYEGRMINFKSAVIDLLVTPNHNIFWRDRHKYKIRKSEIRHRRHLESKINYSKAKELRNKGFTYEEIGNILGFTKQGVRNWIIGVYKPICFKGGNKKDYDFKLGQAIEVITSRPYTHIQFTQSFRWNRKIERKYWKIPQIYFKSNYHYSLTKKRFDINSFLNFLGWYLAEGCVFRRYILICQKRVKYKKDIELMFSQMGLNYSLNKDGYVVCNAPFARYLKSLGNSHSKYIPTWIKHLPLDKLKIILESMMKGDGSIVRGRYKKYVTMSKRLAEGVVEIALKCGYGVSLRRSRKRLYRVNFRHKSLNCRLTSKPKIVDYKGKVYCVDVPNHVIFVERNGNFVWSGNSLGEKPFTKPAKKKAGERSGREADKEEVMARLRALGYW